MNETNDHKFIDLDSIDLTILHNHPDQKKSVSRNFARESHKHFTKEYVSDIKALIIKSTILNHIQLIQEINESDDKSILFRMFSNLKNMLLLHGPELNKSSHLLNDISNVMSILPLDYNRYVIHKMLKNIKLGLYEENLHFRDVSIEISNIPPMPTEERLLIERKLPQFNYSKQIKKNVKPFTVNQIVGAKDKENNWWLSRVLHVYDAPHDNIYWYYIRFEGWGEIHDEWINSRTYRVREYNPRKHFLKRSS